MELINKNNMKLIEQKRQQLRMTISDLCKKAEINESTYYRAKSNEISLSIEKYFILAKILKIKNIPIY